MTYSEKYAGYKWIKIQQWKDDRQLPIEIRFDQLSKHHVDETTFLIAEIRKLAAELDRLTEPSE